MIFLDANLFLRFLAPPATPADEITSARAITLFRAIENGESLATTSEVVLHEVCFILGSKRQYGMQPEAIIDLVGSILRWPAIRFPDGDKSVYLRALDLWEQHPELEFSDAVIAARCERGDHELATFDGHFDRIESVRRWATDPDGNQPTTS